MLPDGPDLVAEEMNDWMDLNGMGFSIHYKSIQINQNVPHHLSQPTHLAWDCQGTDRELYILLLFANIERKPRRFCFQKKYSMRWIDDELVVGRAVLRTGGPQSKSLCTCLWFGQNFFVFDNYSKGGFFGKFHIFCIWKKDQTIFVKNIFYRWSHQ